MRRGAVLGRARPAVARLRRLRWALTALFTLTTAVCLLVLAAVAISIDGRSRRDRLDADLSRRADGLARAVYFDRGTLDLEPLREDELAAGPGGVAVVADGAVRQARTAQELPGAAGLQRIYRTVRQEEETILLAAPAPDGHSVRVAASPVWDDDTLRAAVIVSADPADGEGDHRRLVWSLLLSCLGLVALAGAAGHLLSGRSMRPAVRSLGEQEQFLAEAAHELRTPLATLRLVGEAGMRSPARADELPGRVVTLADQMGRLVGGLLARARVQVGAQEIERVPLRLDQLVEQMVDELPPPAEGPGPEFAVRTAEVVVSGDPELLAQAIRNLLGNAVKHGARPGEPARIEVDVADGRLSVRDHGPGVLPEDRDRIFERSVAGPGGGGTGIGLAIVRWVADLHGGTARITEAPDGGAIAELILPVGP